jgi:hypothetical protein
MCVSDFFVDGMQVRNKFLVDGRDPFEGRVNDPAGPPPAKEVFRNFGEVSEG